MQIRSIGYYEKVIRWQQITKKNEGSLIDGLLKISSGIDFFQKIANVARIIQRHDKLLFGEFSFVTAAIQLYWKISSYLNALAPFNWRM